MFTIIKTYSRCCAAAALATMLVAAAARADITNGLVAYYNFEGMSGLVGETVVDQTGDGHNGVCRQDQNTLKAPTIVAGPSGLGEALSFDGNFYVQIPNASDFNVTSNVTVAAWISVDALTQDWQTIFCRGDWSWRLHRNDLTDYAAFHMSGLSGGYGASGGTTDIAVPKRWLHLVGTYQNGVGAVLYVNGAVEATAAVSGLINISGSDPVTIGAWINGGVLSRQWQGQIDEVRLYNRALTASDVTQLYGFTLAGFNNAPEATTPGTLSFDAPTNVQLTAIVSDDGYPLPANPSNPAPNDPNKLRWGWSVLSQPVTSQGVVWSGNPTNGEAFTYSGSPNAPWTLFTNNPTASFDVPGMYVLQFIASDGQKTNTQKFIVRIRSRNDYRQLGYAYLSPLPGAEYTSPQMSLILVRFSLVLPAAITNLSNFITVTGAQSGQHTGTTKIAADGRTVLFQMSSGFTANEMVTVSLSPGVPVASGGPVPPYQYQFMIAGHWADSSPKYAVASTIVATPMANVNPSPMIQTLAASNGVAG
ncbi:MAG TPA: LamG domain-containing protein, partial [Verrucomicrobiae bacterium]|nr:LamG domain-containing protein [Verrucomicrobiae bacterium]